ncbi:translation initiation factor 4E, partial [Acrasis kona]
MSGEITRPVFEDDDENDQNNEQNDDNLSDRSQSSDEQEEEVPEEIKPLENTWRIWYEKVKVSSDWTNFDHIKELCEFSTVQEFWSCFNTVPRLDVLKAKESFHLMRKNDKGGITPVWEDEENKDGGEWIFRVSKNDAEAVWNSLVFAVIGEQYSDHVKKEGDDICGLTVSMRPVDVIFQLWHRATSDVEEDLNLLVERTKELLPKGVELRCTTNFTEDTNKNLFCNK